MAKFSEEDGVWRTIGGRRVFIKDGEDLATAMKKSGKFNHNDEYDRAHGVYKKEEDEIKERNKKLHREAIKKENEEKFKKFKKELEKSELHKKLEKDMGEELVEHTNDKGDKWYSSKSLDDEEKEFKDKYEKESSRYNIKVNGPDSDMIIEDFEDKVLSNYDEPLTQSEKKQQIDKFVQKYQAQGEPMKNISAQDMKEVLYDNYKIQDDSNKTMNEELRKQVKSRIWAEKTLNEQYKNSDRQGKKELTNYFNQQLRKQRELENKYGKVSEEDFKKMQSDVYKEAEEYRKQNQISSSLQRKAYQKYLKEHPGSKIKFEDFIK